MYGLFYCNELKRNYEIEHNFKYDFVIKTRYDLLLGWKPNFNSLDPKKFYSLPYNKQKKIHKGKDYITLTDFFWISGTEIMDDFVKIAPNFKDYLENEDFVNYFSGKLEYAWIWNMINYNIYDKIELQDFLENPISLDRFLDKNVEFHSNIAKNQTGCLPFTGWKANKTHSRKEVEKKMKTIQEKLKKSVNGGI